MNAAPEASRKGTVSGAAVLLGKVEGHGASVMIGHLVGHFGGAGAQPQEFP